MFNTANQKLVFPLKVTVATLLIGGLIFYVIKKSGTTLSNETILFYMLATLFLFMAYAFVYAYLAGTFRQWVLRKGGIDNQWLWFNHNPPGFESEKAQFLKNQKQS